VTVSSSAAQLVPDKVLAGIEARFHATGEPRGLTVVFRWLWATRSGPSAWTVSPIPASSRD